jgi:hypothetical protein
VDLGGDLLEIEVANYVENTQPTLANRGVLTGPAQQPATTNVVNTIDGPSPGGRYSSAYPLRDGTGRLLVSWTQCRLLEDTQNRALHGGQPRLADGRPRRLCCTGSGCMTRAADAAPVVEPTEGIIFTDAVALQDLALPPVLIDRVAGVDFDAELESEGVGILDIRSVYDIDGVDSSPGGLALLADPGATTAAQRPARFLRVEKAVSIPDEDVRDFDTDAFGVTSAFGMREILGYANVEPDGSCASRYRPTCRSRSPCSMRTDVASVRVTTTGCRPSPVRAQVQRLSRPGRVANRTAVRPVRCRERRSDDDRPAVPEHEPALFADFGETMAQTRARISCQTDCAALALSVDIVFDDVWTDPVAAGRPADPSFAYRYADLTTLPPTSTDCVTQWRSGCA